MSNTLSPAGVAGESPPAAGVGPGFDWASAATLDDLAAGVVRWLEGEVPHTPDYGPPDEETGSIRGHLVALNTAGGILTDSSQPGEVGGWGRQRAFVSGFATAERVDDLSSALASDFDVLLLARPPHCGPDAAGDGDEDIDTDVVPVTEDTAGAACTHAGLWEPADEIAAVWGESCSPAAVGAVLEAWQFAVVDLEWGRPDLLWTRLAEALGIAGPAGGGCPVPDEPLAARPAAVCPVPDEPPGGPGAGLDAVAAVVEAAVGRTGDSALAGHLDVETDTGAVELVYGYELEGAEVAQLAAELAADGLAVAASRLEHGFRVLTIGAAEAGEARPTCRTCLEPTAPGRVDAAYDGGGEVPLESYLLDAVLEALDGAVVGIGPDPGGESGDWDEVALDVAYADGAVDPVLGLAVTGDLVLAVPAVGSRPPRRFRVVLEELKPAGGVA